MRHSHRCPIPHVKQASQPLLRDAASTVRRTPLYRPVMLIVSLNTVDRLPPRNDGKIVVIDGAMGTELEARGARMDDDAWCGVANLEVPEIVRQIHEDHIRAGADVVITNTFMSGVGPMERAGVGDLFEDGLRNAVGAARSATAAADRRVAVAGSVGVTHWGQPGDGMNRSTLLDGYARQVDLLATFGVDLIALEMVIDARLAEPAIEAALSSGLPVWLGLSMRDARRDPSDTHSLPSIDREAKSVAEVCLGAGVDAVNVMHTDVRDIGDALAMLRPLWSGTLGVYPHHGRWSRPHWSFVDIPPAELVGLAQQWRDLGATMFGGCCGLGSPHIAALRAAADSWNTDKTRGGVRVAADRTADRENWSE